jgi:glyoxylase-like metal-dependent hydrolase (beta-lactamase superfamily II)
MDSFDIGRFRVHRIEEWQGRFAPPEHLLHGFEPEAYGTWAAGFEPDFVRDGLIYGFLQSWLIEADGVRILYDTGAGNAKERPAIPIFGNLDSDFLGNLARAGCRPEDIDIVICSHLHIDHVGWNTTLVDGQWVPTFPKARYLLPAVDREFWDPSDAVRYARARGAEVNSGVFEDSVQPILDSGRAVLVEDGHRVVRGVSLHAGPGHTPGHMVLKVVDGGECALFVGDILHHPMQVYRPDWNSVYCEDRDQARATRLRILAEAADTGARVVPAHFGGDHFIWVAREGDGFRPVYRREAADAQA